MIDGADSEGQLREVAKSQTSRCIGNLSSSRTGIQMAMVHVHGAKTGGHDVIMQQPGL